MPFGEPDLLQNWDFIGRCYDILKIDPLRIEDGAKLESAIERDQEFDTTADKRYKKPKWTSYIPVTGGKNETHSVTISSAYDFQTFNKIQGSVSASDVTGNLFKTTLSGSYSSTAKTTDNKERVLTYITQTVNLYKLALVEGTPAISENLRKAIEKLPVKTSLARTDLYNDFFQRFGTHYSTNVLFGGRVYQRITVEQSEYSSFLEEGVDVHSEVSATFNIAKGEVRAGSEDKRSKKFVSAIKNSTDQIVYVGGTPQSMFDMWASYVENRPAPIEVELSPLYNLVTSELFPGDPDVSAKQKLLQSETDSYIRSRGKNVEGAVLRFKDKVIVRLAVRGTPRFLSPDEKQRRVTTMQARHGHEWVIINASNNAGAVRTGDVVLLQIGSGGYLDARSGADDDYETGAGLTAISQTRPDAPVVRWKLVLADDRRREEIVAGDYVRLQSEWENEDGYFGYLKGETDARDANQRVFSFGKQTDPGTIWRLDRAK
jgi:hypothetical protein